MCTNQCTIAKLDKLMNSWYDVPHNPNPLSKKGHGTRKLRCCTLLAPFAR